MFNFKKTAKSKAAEPSAPNALEQQEILFKIAILEAKVAGLENCIMQLCQGLAIRFNGVDQNIKQLDSNMHNLAAMTLRPPKDILGGPQEIN